MNQFLLGEDCELVDSLLVGLRSISVVPLNLEDVFLKDEPPVGFLFWGPSHSVLRFPVLEGVSLLLIRIVEEEEGNGGQGGNDQLFSHIK